MDGRTGVGLQTHDLAQQARRAEPGMQGKVEAIRVALSKAYTSAKRIAVDSGLHEIAGQIADGMRLSVHAWDRFQKFYDLTNHSGVNAVDKIGEGRNKWISPDAPEHAQARQHHADLQEMWKSLPVPMRNIYHVLRKFYDTRHEQMANTSVHQLTELRKMVPDGDRKATEALIKFIRDKDSISDVERDLLHDKVPGFTPEPDVTNKSPEYAKFRQQVREIRALPYLRSVKGEWFPSMREGNWVVEGRFKMGRIAEKFGGVERADGTWEFETPELRHDFYEAMANDKVLKDLKFLQDEDVAYKKDPDTGGVLHDAEGTPIYETEPSTRETRVTGEPGVVGYKGAVTTAERRMGVKATEGEPDVVHRFKATYNPLVLEFYKSQFEAAQRHADLKAAHNPEHFELTHVEPRRDTDSTYLNPVKADRALRAMVDGLQKSEGWAEIDTTARSKLLKDLNEQAVRHIMGTSARANFLPRRYAQGARKSILNDFLKYNTNTSYSLAELTHRNEIAGAYKAMDDYVESMKLAGAPGDPQGQYGILRRQLQSSLHRRADYTPEPLLDGWFDKGMGRVMQLSYMDKLISPMNWVLQGTEIMMSGAPMLAGEFGAGAYAAIGRAYHKLGLQHFKGFEDAATIARAGVGGLAKLPDNPQRFKDYLKTRLTPVEYGRAVKMIDHLELYGHLDRDSSMEVSRVFDPDAGKAMRVVDYVDNITRQIPAQIDNGNRIVIGLAAMEMALKKKPDDMAYALKVAERYAHDTTGLYAKYNEAEMFRHKLLGPAMQFKRFAQRQTANWLTRAYQAMWFGDIPPEQRWVARRQLMYLGGTLTIMSGVLGLPIEPIKAVINGLSYFTGFNSDDAENWVRQTTAKVLGPDLAEILTRGVPRWLGVGIGTRVALDSMWTYGTPGKKADDLLVAGAHLLGGAPLGYLMEAIEGTGYIVDAGANFAKGYNSEGWNNLRQGFELVAPLKVATDIVHSSAGYFGGAQTRTRYGQSLGYQPTALEATMEALGVRSGRSQELADKRRAMRRDISKHDEQRNAEFAAYVHASTPGEKTAIWNNIQHGFNQRWPTDMNIKFGDLIKADRRWQTRKEGNPDWAGLTLSRGQQSLLPNYRAYMTQ
jgi:hypothetical protein